MSVRPLLYLSYIERVIRTVKEEEIWPNLYDVLSETRVVIKAYVNYYNDERIYSALDYRTPNEVAAAYNTLAATLMCLVFEGPLSVVAGTLRFYADI